jgi:hypothetical protein
MSTIEPISLKLREPAGSDFLIAKSGGSTFRYCWLGYKKRFPRKDSKRMRWCWNFTIFLDKNQRLYDYAQVTHWLPAETETLPALVNIEDQENG